MARETSEQSLARWADLHKLQAAYPEFADFWWDVLNALTGFECSPMQRDICEFMQYGPQYSMVQAQRGEAKTSMAGAFAVWNLIHDPTYRVLIVSGGKTVAEEISNWVIQIINNMEILTCMRPDVTNGDRSSVKAFDIHYSLRGAEKSPSIACVGIKGQLQGRRADLLIPDDIETSINSDTEVNREKILMLSRDFSSICSKGKIMYLGTPQSIDSVYNTLPGRGYTVRIWPGRFPTLSEEENYGDALAPYIVEQMRDNPGLRKGGGLTGDRGQATDPVIVPEHLLIKKELDEGPAWFQLQHMLDTRLMDKDRYPLALNRIIFMQVQNKETPVHLNFSPSVDTQIAWPPGHSMQRTPIYRVASTSPEFKPFSGTYMYVDPSGGGKNGDELAYAVTKFLAGFIYVVDVGGRPGGIHKDNLDWLTSIAEKWRPHTVGVERNYGNGALAQVWRPLLLAKHSCTIEEPWETGQKELRIIDILEPLLGSNRLVIDDKLLRQDFESISSYPSQSRMTYSLFHQMAKITREKGALAHDDRVDALAGACRPWVALLAQSSEQEADKYKKELYAEMMRNPLKLPDYAAKLYQDLYEPQHEDINPMSLRFSRRKHHGKIPSSNEQTRTYFTG